jgi:hypothetical protein
MHEYLDDVPSLQDLAFKSDKHYVSDVVAVPFTTLETKLFYC